MNPSVDDIEQRIRHNYESMIEARFRGMSDGDFSNIDFIHYRDMKLQLFADLSKIHNGAKGAYYRDLLHRFKNN